MKLVIKNKIFSFGGSSTVCDENKNPVFTVKGKVFSITRKKKICDLNGNVLFTVKNKWFNWFAHRAYVLDAGGNKVATVKDKPFNFKRDYIVEGYKDELKFEGGFFSYTCQIYKNGEVIGTLRRNLDLFRDSFTLEAEEENMPFLVALVIAVDNIVDNKTKS